MKHGQTCPNNGDQYPLRLPGLLDTTIVYAVVQMFYFFFPSNLERCPPGGMSKSVEFLVRSISELRSRQPHGRHCDEKEWN
jgi:hypothetical protein